MKPTTIQRLKDFQAQLAVIKIDAIELDCDVDVEALDHDGPDTYPFQDTCMALTDFVNDVDACIARLNDVIKEA